MKIYMVSYRDEFRPDPVELAAYASQVRAQQTVADLIAKRQQLAAAGMSDSAANTLWRQFLAQEGIPESKFIVLTLEKYGNFAFKVNEHELIH